MPFLVGFVFITCERGTVAFMLVVSILVLVGLLICDVVGFEVFAVAGVGTGFE
jgi:hypothetical protein